MAKQHKPRHYKPVSKRKGKPISFRLLPEDHALLVRAAVSKEETLTSYVTAAAIKQAKKDLGQ